MDKIKFIKIISLLIILIIFPSCKPVADIKEADEVEESGRETPSPSTPTPYSPTVSPTETEYNQIEATQNNSIEEFWGTKELNLVAFVFPNTDHLVIMDINSKQIKQIEFSIDDTPIGAAWSNDGCELHVTIRTSEDIQLFRMDINGLILEEIYLYKDIDNNEPWHTWPSLSPDGRRISYAVWIGQLYVSAEIQNVEVRNLFGDYDVFQLSQNGGSWNKGGVWSPDGSKIAFSDLDNNGISQIFLSSPEGDEIKQLTTNSESGTRFEAIKWSPDGNLFGVIFREWDDSQEKILSSSIIIFSVNGEHRELISFNEDEVIIGTSFWWSKDNERIYLITHDYDKALGKNYWLSSYDGEVLFEIYDNQISEEFDSMLIPTKDIDLLIYSIRDNYYLYDSKIKESRFWIESSLFYPKRNSWLQDYSNIVPSPNNEFFVGDCYD